MKAVAWHGTRDVRVENVPDPAIVNPCDAVVRVTSTAICGSDLQLYNGFMLMMQPGDILGHEFVGIVEEVGPAVRALRPGDRVVVPAVIACGSCEPCRRELFSLCDNSNPNASLVERLYGYSGAGRYGYSHLYGGYAGAQAEYVRVPFADCGPLKVPPNLTDEQVLFLSDVFPAGYQAAENANIKPGDVVAVWGCGPAGQFAIRSAFMLGASRVIAIDRFNERLDLARESGAEAVNHDDCDVLDALYQFTGGRGADACIDCVGLEAHAVVPDVRAGALKQASRHELDRADVIREAVTACGKGGTVSVPSACTGLVDIFSLRTLFGKGLQIRTGAANTQRYMGKLLDRIAQGDIDPRFVITHRGALEDAPRFYREMARREDAFVKSVLRVSVPVIRDTVYETDAMLV